MATRPERIRHDRFQRLETLRAGEERLARAALQQALAQVRDAETRLGFCRVAYREIIADANAKLTGVIDVRRLPIMQLMVADARRAVQMAERQLNLAELQADRAKTAWIEAKRAAQLMEKASDRATAALRTVLQHEEQKSLDELATLRAGRVSG